MSSSSAASTHDCPLYGRILIDRELQRYRVAGRVQVNEAPFWQLARLDEAGGEVPGAMVRVRVPAKGWSVPGFTLQNANALAG